VTAQPGSSETFTLTVTMTATLPAGMNEADIERQFKEFIEGPGNTRVDFMTVEKEAEAEAA
jgi:glycine cleavage system regulatory protein